MFVPSASLHTVKREKILFEIITVKEEMSHAFSVVFADKAKCTFRIIEP